jgi:hypothetical protein
VDDQHGLGINRPCQTPISDINQTGSHQTVATSQRSAGASLRPALEKTRDVCPFSLNDHHPRCESTAIFNASSSVKRTTEPTMPDSKGILVTILSGWPYPAAEKFAGFFCMCASRITKNRNADYYRLMIGS